MSFKNLPSKKWGLTRLGGWLDANKSVVAIHHAFISRGQLYNVKKHSTRSKYSGYYIVQLQGSLVSRELKIAKNLTKAEVMAWIKLLKG
jgi:hypothetical protein